MTLLSPAAFWALFTTSWGYVSTALPKLAVGILISRIFRPQQWLRVSIISYCIVLNILAVIVLIFSFAQCDPPAGQWDPFHHPNAHCRDKNIQLGLSTVTSGISCPDETAASNYQLITIIALRNICICGHCIYHLSRRRHLELADAIGDQSRRNQLDEPWSRVSFVP